MTDIVTWFSICSVSTYMYNIYIEDYKIVPDLWKDGVDVTVLYYSSHQLIIKLNIKSRFLNAVHFRQGLLCTIGLANNLIDSGQLGAKNRF